MDIKRSIVHSYHCFCWNDSIITNSFISFYSAFNLGSIKHPGDDNHDEDITVLNNQIEELRKRHDCINISMSILSITYCINTKFYSNIIIPTVTIQSIKVSVFFRATYPGL